MSVEKTQTKRSMPRSRWAPSARAGVAVAVGSALFGVAIAAPPLITLGFAWWIVVIAVVAADIALLRHADAMDVQRSVENVLSLGAQNRVEVILRSRSRVALKCQVRDEPPLDFTVDRRGGVCSIPGNGSAGIDYHVRPANRGNYDFGSVAVRATAGFGLVFRQMTFDLRQEVKVYPNLQNIRSLELAAQKERLVDLGVHRTRIRGAGLEFESLRAYVPGDEPRRIDWKATARRAEPITRDFDIERSQHIILCMDLGRTMASRLGLLTKADHAVNAATLLAHVAESEGDWVGLFAFSDRPTAYLPPRKRHFQQVLDTLYGLQAQGAESDYRRAFLETSQRFRKRGLIVLLTDLVDPESSARLIRYSTLLTRRHVVLCAALSDYELYEIAHRTPTLSKDLYERTVATEMLADRQKALDELRRRGAIAFDATPETLCVAVLNHYLEAKERARV